MSLYASLVTQAAEPEPCASVRLIDVGWTDITVTTAVIHQALESLGYKTKVNLLLVPVTYCSLANSDLNIFLGSWVPTMTDDTKWYAGKGMVGTLHANLEGVKYILAVPQYVYDGGLRSFADITKFSDKLGNKIYDIESGNDGNRVAQSMIDENTFKLDRFKLVEPDEAGILSQMQRAIRRSQWVVLLGWEPHLMNTHFRMEYLEDGDDSFGPSYSDATIYTNARKDCAQEYASVDQLLKNLSFTFEMENKLMDAVLNENKKPEEAAKAWLKDHPEQLGAWLAGVTTCGGQSAITATRPAFAGQATGCSLPALGGP